MSQQNIEKIKLIEKKSYPQFMWQYEEAKNLDDIYKIINKNKKDGEIFFHIDEDWYLLGVNRNEEISIADLASTKKLSFLEMNCILDLIKKFGNKKIVADCRDSTSYNLLKLLEQRGTIEVITESPWLWGNEKMYKLSFTIKPKSFHEWFSFTERAESKSFLLRD